MTAPVPRANYSGLLLRLKTEHGFPVVAERLADVTHRGPVSAHGWHLYEWVSEFDAGVDARGVSEDGDRYVYPLLLREVEERFLLASTHSEVVQQFITRNRLARSIERPVIDIGGVVRESIFPSTPEFSAGASSYKMGALYASVDGFGRSVRTISLFGDDLANAGVVRDMLKYLNPFRVALRETRNEQEVLSISTQGEISFYFRGAASLDGVDKALAHVRRGNFIHWRSKQ